MMVRDLMVGAMILATSAGQTLAQEKPPSENVGPAMTLARRRRSS